ncbi:hypothetical protein DYGSA30_32070 [Dyella sp. GSA-30]|nr:hypothetical protein DYGSA30_32070 [Dyella sp. GSA-30]
MVFDVVVGADDRVIDDPEIGLAQLFIETDGGLLGIGGELHRSLVQLGHIERSWRLFGAGIGGRPRYPLKQIERRHTILRSIILPMILEGPGMLVTVLKKPFPPVVAPKPGSGASRCNELKTLGPGLRRGDDEN